MPQVRYTADGYPYYAPDESGDVTAPGSVKTGWPFAAYRPKPEAQQDSGISLKDIAARIGQASEYNPLALVAGYLDKNGTGAKPLDLLFGLGGQPRYQLWPERMIRSATTLPGEVYSGAVPVIDPATGHTAEPLIWRTQDLAGLTGISSLPLAPRNALGMTGGRPPTIPRIEKSFREFLEKNDLSITEEQLVKNLESRIRQIDYDLSLARKNGYDVKGGEFAAQRGEKNSIRARLAELKSSAIPFQQQPKNSNDDVIAAVERSPEGLSAKRAETSKSVYPPELVEALKKNEFPLFVGGHMIVPIDGEPELEEETPSQKMKNYIERMRRSGGRADPNGNSALTATIVPPAGYRNLMTNAAP